MGGLHRRAVWQLLALALLIAAAVGREGGTAASPALERPSTGLPGRLVAIYSPDGNRSFAGLTLVDLESLTFRSRPPTLNDISGFGDHIFVAIGAPARLAQYKDEALTEVSIPDLEFLSVPALSPDAKRLAFARDTRRDDSGEEIWVWDLLSKKGHIALTLPEDRYSYSLAWLDQRTMVAGVGGKRPEESPELVIIRDDRILRRYRTNSVTFTLIPGGRLIQTVHSGPWDNEVRRAYVRALEGGGIHRIPDRWLPLCLSPDKKQILMGRRTDLRTIARTTELGLAPVLDPTKVTSFGVVPGGLYGCVWQDEVS